MVPFSPPQFTSSYYSASTQHHEGRTWEGSDNTPLTRHLDSPSKIQQLLLRLTQCEIKTSRLVAENKSLRDSVNSLHLNVVNLAHVVYELEHVCETQHHSIQQLMLKYSEKMKLEGSIKEPQEEEQQEEEQSGEKIIKKRKIDQIGLHEIRRRIPWRLNSGYVIHALLCCALNGFGADFRRDEDGKVTGIFVSSYWLVKACCIYIVKYILCKRVKSADAGTWDKSLKQHWFDGWVSKESFLANAKVGKKDTLNELLDGHDTLSPEEKNVLLEKVESQQV